MTKSWNFEAWNQNPRLWHRRGFKSSRVRGRLFRQKLGRASHSTAYWLVAMGEVLTP